MKILLCNTSYPQIEQRLAALLTEASIVSCEPSDIVKNLDGVDVVIPSVARIDANIISQGSFGLIQQLGVGVDSVDIGAAARAGVWVANVPSGGSGNAESVAELAVAMMITLARKLDEARANTKQGIFFKPTGLSLLNKTVCIVGFGDIGMALAARLNPFGVRITALRKHPQKPIRAGLNVQRVYGMDALQDALSDADFVVLAIPETSDTRRLIDTAALSAMKKGAFLINVARGGIVDLDALAASLQNDHLAGAGIDVFEQEPMDPSHPVFKQNVIATPHIGGNTDESIRGVLDAIAENVRRYEHAQPPLHVLNNVTGLARGLVKSK